MEHSRETKTPKEIQEFLTNFPKLETGLELISQFKKTREARIEFEKYSKQEIKLSPVDVIDYLIQTERNIETKFPNSNFVSEQKEVLSNTQLPNLHPKEFNKFDTLYTNFKSELDKLNTILEQQGIQKIELEKQPTFIDGNHG